MQNVRSINGVDKRVKRAGKMRIYCADVQRKQREFSIGKVGIAFISSEEIQTAVACPLVNI
jgi:hypothetical protein